MEKAIYIVTKLTSSAYR